MNRQCTRISPESGSSCLLLDSTKTHKAGHVGQDGGTKVAWATDIFDFLRWKRWPQ